MKNITATLTAYWNGSNVQSVVELVYKVGSIEESGRSFLPIEEIEKILNIDLSEGIAEKEVEIRVFTHSLTMDRLEFPLIYNGWTTLSRLVIVNAL